MKTSPFFAALLLALPWAVTAQTRPAPAPAKTPAATAKTVPGTQQVTEVTEDLDPETGKVIRRTTRTYSVPVAVGPTAAKGAVPSSGTATTPSTSAALESSDAQANDSQVSDFFREKTAVSKLSGNELVEAYSRFMDTVREDRRNWKPADWNRASAVLNSLNIRYEQLRSSFSFDDKLSIRSHQAEFQALRTAKQISKDVSDKL